MLNFTQLSWPWLLVRGIIAVVFGIIAMIWPAATVAAAAVLLAVWLLLDGVIAVVRAIMMSQRPTADRVLVGIIGLIGVAAGIFGLTYPFVAVQAVGILFAIWLIAAGITEVILGWRIRNYISGEWLIIAAGVLSVIVGVVVLVVPGLALGAFVIMIAIAALIWGVSSIIAAFGLRSKVKQGEQARTPAHAER